MTDLSRPTAPTPAATPPGTPSPSAGPLFRGAARLGTLLGALDLPWTRVAPVIGLFPSELRDDFELGLAQVSPPLRLRTRGDGKAMTFRMARYLEQQGVPQDRLRRLLLTAAHCQHQHLLFELGVDGTGPSRLTWLCRQPLTLTETRAWLAADGVLQEALDRVDLVALTLNKTQVHAIGETLEEDGHTTLLVALTTPTDGSSWPRLDAAAHQAGVDDATWALLEAHMPALAEADTRVVLELREGHIVAVRLDIDDVPTALVQALAPAPWPDRVGMLAQLAGVDRLPAASFRLEIGTTADSSPTQPALSCQAWTHVR